MNGAATANTALAAGAVVLPACKALVMLVTAPIDDEVMVTTIVQPPGGIVDHAANVISAGATVTPVQVPVLPLVVVTPAGMGSVKAAASVSSVALVLPSVSVTVALPPTAIVAGAIVFARLAPAVVTVSGALATGVVPAPVCSVLVTLVTVPGVPDYKRAECRWKRVPAG